MRIKQLSRFLAFGVLLLVSIGHYTYLLAGICTNCTLTPATATICVSQTQAIVLGNTAGPPATATGWIYSTTTDDLTEYGTAPGSTASNTYTVTGLGVGTYYFRALVNGGADTTNVSAVVTIVAAPIPGTLSNPGVFCATTPGGTAIALLGHTGNVVRWESRTSAGAWTAIAATAGLTGYTIPAGITDSLWYRAIVGNAGCNLPTPEALLAVNPAVAGGTLAGGPDESCANTGVFTLTLSGQVGVPQRWERKTPAAVVWTDLGLAVGTVSHTVTPGSTQTFESGCWYRNPRVASPLAAFGLSQ